MTDNVLIVRDLIERQEWQGLFTVISADSIREAAEVMQARGVSAISVVDGGQLVGVLSEKDVAHVVAAGDDPGLILVSDRMTTDLTTAEPEMSLGKVTKMMLDHNVRHLPVVEDDQLITMLSIRDVLRLFIERLETENELLRSDVEWLQYYQQ